jgi:exopolyphosphatase / guanosine-5'-triphosphate,3'-diphosphate pyrophosphatase
MRVGAIDIGTNSVLLLVAERQPDGTLRRIIDLATITRLGQGVDATGELAAEAVTRTLECVKGYARHLAEHEVSVTGAVGTSAMRDARGGEGFRAAFESHVGVVPEIITGEREAALTFDGALTGLPEMTPVAVFDIGGGSTEIIKGRFVAGRPVIDAAVSLDVGAVRLTERIVTSDPPSPDELEAIRRHTREVLDGAPAIDGLPLVGVAGTITTLAALAHRVEPYDGERVHGSELTAADLQRCSEQLAGVALDERKRLRGLDPKRADVIIAGSLICQEVRAWADAERVLVSDRGVRWGLAKELAAAAAR